MYIIADIHLVDYANYFTPKVSTANAKWYDNSQITNFKSSLVFFTK